MSGEIKYPDIAVELIGQDGNGFMTVGRVISALRKGGVSMEEIEAFTNEATSGDYDHLLATVMAWVDLY